MGIPRRDDPTAQKPAEQAIRNAIVEVVEKLPADPLLTEAALNLHAALNLVSDFIDSQPREVHALVAENLTAAPPSMSRP